MRKLIIALSAFGLVAGSVPSLAAAPCRDAKGKFIKCPTKKAPAPTRCRDANSGSLCEMRDEGSQARVTLAKGPPRHALMGGPFHRAESLLSKLSGRRHGLKSKMD